MSKVFVPDFCFSSYEDVTAVFLKEQGVRAILLDIDNTLEPYENPTPSERLLTWFSMLDENDIQVAFISNNNKARVERFNKELGYLAFANAKKPFKGNILKALRILNVSAENAIFMGDQILTDVWAAHNAGLRAILLPPICDRRDPFTGFKRLMEKPFLKKYRKEHPESYESEIWTRWKL